MRKRYERPKINEVEIICAMLSTSLTINTGSQGDFKEDFVRESRGTWGNLWNENDSGI